MRAPASMSCTADRRPANGAGDLRAPDARWYATGSSSPAARRGGRAAPSRVASPSAGHGSEVESGSSAGGAHRPDVGDGEPGSSAEPGERAFPTARGTARRAESSDGLRAKPSPLHTEHRTGDRWQVRPSSDASPSMKQTTSDVAREGRRGTRRRTLGAVRARPARRAHARPCR